MLVWCEVHTVNHIQDLDISLSLSDLLAPLPLSLIVIPHQRSSNGLPSGFQESPDLFQWLTGQAQPPERVQKNQVSSLISYLHHGSLFNSVYVQAWWFTSLMMTSRMRCDAKCNPKVCQHAIAGLCIHSQNSGEEYARAYTAFHSSHAWRPMGAWVG